jgi:hypothetical protein
MPCVGLKHQNRIGSEFGIQLEPAYDKLLNFEQIYDYDLIFFNSINIALIDSLSTRSTISNTTNNIPHLLIFPFI